ncbi:MAG: GWxTD domain-containing protein [Candidatus Eisenbacteria bacterium]|nr:GWxTD domain-containing protein [Candidatus Eisenbacteria bacterium]
MASLSARTLVLALVVSASCAVVTPLSAGGFPVEGTGDIEFQADCASFLGPDGTVEEEFYVRVQSEQLNFERRGKKNEAHVLLTVTFVNELGDAYEIKSREFTPDLEDKPARDDSNLFMVRYPITPAAKKVLITLEDLRARRRGIFYLFTKERRKGIAEADVEVSVPLSGTLSMSDIQFARSVSPSQSQSSGSFAKSGLDVIPNPTRSYGLRRGTLFAYFEVYDQTEFALERGRVFYDVVTSILDVNRETALSDTQKIVSSSRQWVHTIALDVSKLPTGSYWFRTEVCQQEGLNRILRQSQFNVLWQDASWQRNDSYVLDEASLFLTNGQYKAFKRMNAGEREGFLDGFWRRLDPTPGTATNEVREEFDRRVAYANAQFSFFTKGMLSDRGRIYVRYGEPDLIDKQVVPTAGDAADILLDATLSTEQENLDRRGITPRLVGNDKRSYEVWIYNMKGRPLFSGQDQMMTQSLGLKFVFVDDTGAGNYVLDYSSDRSNKYR